jgi:hypothetical protein
VIVADYMNNRVQVLRLVVGADGISTHLWSSSACSEAGRELPRDSSTFPSA